MRILYWLERLQKEAVQQGGALHILTGYTPTGSPPSDAVPSTFCFGIFDFKAGVIATAAGTKFVPKARQSVRGIPEVKSEEQGGWPFSCRNHETLNVAGRFRYSTPEGLQDFATWGFLERMAASMKAKFASFRCAF